MDFLVLGPLEARDGDRAVRLGGYRQRLVLAVLLVYAERAVSADRLIDAVWGEEPPRTARKTLQVYISRLRGLLGSECIEPTPHGYVLHLAPDGYDLHRFGNLAAEGHRLAATDPPAAAGVFRRALALWRGMPWGELGDEVAIQPEAERLRELRLSVLEDRIDADLASGHAPGLIGELDGLVDEYPFRERFTHQLMLALYRSGRQADALRRFQAARGVLGEELGIEPSRKLQNLEEQILLQDPSIDGPEMSASIEDWTLARNPYKGLRSFTEADAADFFGRVTLTQELADRVHRQSFVAVVGASGSGKSSTVMAGLLPRLRSLGAPGPDDFVLINMVPGSHPIAEFQAAIRASSGETPNMRSDSLAMLRAVQDSGTNVLLVIDQFEELFHHTCDQAERTLFIRNLVEAIEDPHSQLTVLITLRADFFARALAEPALGRLIDAGLVNMLSLLPDEMEAAAARPAEQAGVHIEPELIAELVSDMTDQPGSLPLFQYVLTQLFDERAGIVLTRSAYRRIGGLRGALARRAEGVYQTLDEEEQRVARQLLLRLVTVGEDLEASRRRVARQELESLAVDPGSVETVLNAFDEARLLTFDRSPVTGAATVEVAHEALLREWPRMRGWLDDAREDLRLQRALTGEVAEWEAAGRDPDYLLTGSRLELHAGRTADRVIELTTPEQDFIASSIGRRDDERRLEEERRTQELRVEQRAVRRLRWLVAVVSVAALVAAALTAFATNQSREAAASQREARARELANASLANLDTDPELAILLALQALDVGTDDNLLLRDAQEALHLALSADRLLGTDIGEYAVAFHPESGLFIGGNPPRLVNPVTGEIRLQLPDQKPGWTVQSVAVSRDGSLLATGTDKRGEVKVREAISGQEVAEFTGPNDGIGSMAFSPDGRLLAALAPWGGGVFVWDVESGSRLVVADDPVAWEVCCPGLAIDFSPDGQQLAVTTGSSAEALQGEVKLLDLTTGDWAGALQGHEGPVTGVEYLPGGDNLITSSMDGTIRMWDVATRAQIGSRDAGTLQVTSLDLSDDGRVLLTGGDGGKVSVWSVTDSAIGSGLDLPGHSSLVLQVALDGSGTVGSSIDMDGSVLVWDVSAAGPGEVAAWPGQRTVGFDQNGNRVATTGPEGRDVVVRETSNWQPQLVITDVAPYVGDPNEEWGVVNGVSISPDGSRLITTTRSRLEAANGSVALWDASTGEPIRTLLEHPYMKAPAAWSGDGRRVAVATCDDFGIPARVWDGASGELVFAVPPAPCGQTVDLNHTGELLAVQTLLTPGPNVQVWNVGSGELVMEVNHAPLWIGAVAFNPDGTRLLTGGADGTVLIWNVPAGNLVRTLTGHTGPVESAIWSSDGSTVATGSHDGTARMWDAATGETRMVLGGHDIFPSVALSPDGRYLATGTEMGVQVWALDIQELTDIARRRVGRPLSPAECIAYHFETCPTAP